jgi:hypothetical protein
MNITRIFMGMTCREFSEQTSAQYERHSGWLVRLRMAWHRLLCVHCRRLAQQWKAIRAMLRREPPEATMPQAMREKIRRNLGAGD